jgi:hypothetical protein
MKDYVALGNQNQLHLSLPCGTRAHKAKLDQHAGIPKVQKKKIGQQVGNKMHEWLNVCTQHWQIQAIKNDLF